MAVNYELLNKGGISLSTNFDAIIDKPLDARQVVPSVDGIQNLIDNGGAYAGMVTYVTSEKRLYEVYDNEGTLSYRHLTYTEAELTEMIGQVATAAMEFKGATATLPEAPSQGDLYKVAGENINITIDGVAAKTGDSIVYDGTKWYLIPSGDDIEDTWRPVTGVDNDATLAFANGNNTTADVSSDGTVKFHHNKLTAAPVDIATDEDRKTRTYLTAVEVDEYGHVTNYKTATENVEDTDTTYEFECQVEHSNVHFSVKASDADQAQEICVDAYTRNEVDEAIANAVAEAKTDAANKAAVVLSEAQAYADGKDGAITAAQEAADAAQEYAEGVETTLEELSQALAAREEEVNGLITENATAIEDLAGYVGEFTHSSAKTVVEYINAKTDGIATSGNLEALGQRVTATESDIATIKGDYLKAADIADFETKENVKKVADDLAAFEEEMTKALDAIDTGVMSVAEGTDIVVTPGENGQVTVAHKEFTTGAYTKDPADSIKEGDVYLMTSVTVDNGHVTGANVKSLADALAGMTFIFNGGTSGASNS